MGEGGGGQRGCGGGGRAGSELKWVEVRCSARGGVDMHDLHAASSGYWRAASPAYGCVLGQRDYAGRRYEFAGYYDVIILREMIFER